jgi:hypothetical protein
MLVIAPMPVDRIHDDFVMESLRRGRVIVPDLPMGQENIAEMAIDAPVKLVPFEPTKSELEFEMDFDFPQRYGNHANRTVLPPRKLEVNNLSPVQGKQRYKIADASLAFRPAAPLAVKVASDFQNYEKNVVKRTYLIALLLFFLVIVIGGLIFTVKHYADSSNTRKNDYVGLRYVHIESPSFSHLKAQYGEKVKADQQQAERAIEKLPTQIVREVNGNNGH